MKVQVHNWQDKASELIAALKRKDVSIVDTHPDILLIDFDAATPYYTKKIERAYQQGAEIVLYSHGAPVITAYDMVWESDSRVRVYLAQSQGQKEVMQAYGYPNPIEVIGWHYCKQKKFKPAKKINTILFAPHHPHGDGYLQPTVKQSNTDTYDKLKQTPYKLSIMHFGDIRHNGLRYDRGVDYIISEKSNKQSVKEIDKADIVVSNLGTFASLAIARGKPVVVYGQDICPHDGFNDATIYYVKNWDKYRDMLHYPYDISKLKPKAAQHTIEFAAQNEAKEWREKFIGNSLDEDRLYEILKNLLEADKTSLF